MRTWIRFALLAVLPLGLLATGIATRPADAGKPVPPSPPPPPVTYAIDFPDADVALVRMNESGYAVGVAHGVEDRAVIYDVATGLWHDLTNLAHAQGVDPAPQWVLHYAEHINESGQVAGSGSRMENGVRVKRAFRFTPQRPDPSDPLKVLPAQLEAMRTFISGTTVYVKGINDPGDVVLEVTTRTDTDPTPGPKDSVWLFSGQPGAGASAKLFDAARPRGINNAGQICGVIDLGTKSCAFRYTPGAPLETFGVINGTTSGMYNWSDAFAINQSGVIAGWARPGKPVKGREDLTLHAVRLSDTGTWQDLGAGRVDALNTPGVATGYAPVTGSSFVYIAGVRYVLFDLIVNRPDDLGWLMPLDITDSGYICGSAGFRNPDGTTSWQGFVMRPL